MARGWRSGALLPDIVLEEAPKQDVLLNLDAPYVQDAVLEEAVYQAGTAYFEGASTLEEAWDELQSQISLYMAE